MILKCHHLAELNQLNTELEFKKSNINKRDWDLKDTNQF